MAAMTYAPVGDVLELVREPIDVEPTAIYRPIGVRSFGRGIFHYDSVEGSKLGKLRWFKVRPDELIISNIKGWEGAIAVSSERELDCIASNRFLSYRPRSDTAVVPYLHFYLLSEPGLRLVRRASPGSTDRNLTLGIKAFESLEIPLPPPKVQREIAARVGGLISHARALSELAARDSPSLLMSTLPVLTQDVFDRSRAGRAPIADLADFVSDIVHPGDDLGEASVFVGLQHVESHSGRRVGGISLGLEKGRKFRFRPGDVVYGYLRPYLNKVWVADCHGLCSVDQYILRPKPNVMPGLLAYGLRTRSTLDEAIRLTHSLQLPRLRSGLLAAVEIPVPAKQPAVVERQLDRLGKHVCETVDLRRRQAELIKAYEPAVLNDVFASMA